MALELGAFITVTRPEKRGDTFKQCLEMANELFDTVTVVDGINTWPKEFNWPVIGEHFQCGYETTDADWVFHLDTDFIFHQKDFSKIRQQAELFNKSPALTFHKYQFIQPDRYNLKSRLVIAVNKSKFGKRIKFNSGGDLCQPSLDGAQIMPSDVPDVGIPFYNYEKLIKTEVQIKDDVGRMDRAYMKHFGHYMYGFDGSDDSAYLGWLEMALGRFKKPQKEIPLEDHPKYMQETIKKLTPSMWGYSAFGKLKENNYAENSRNI